MRSGSKLLGLWSFDWKKAQQKYLESLYEYFKTILEVILMISDQEVF